MTRAALMAALPQTGVLQWIGLRPAPLLPLKVVGHAELLAGRGLVGDRASRGRKGGARQVTLLQAEHLVVMASVLGLDAIDPALLRRNLVVSGINLLALERRRFRIGEVEFQGTGPCDPCPRMEAALGTGGWNAMTGHGGITARVLSDGEIRVGDGVFAVREEK